MINKIFPLCLVVYLGCGGTTQAPPTLSDKFHDIQTQTFTNSCANGGCHDAVTQQAQLCLTKDSCYNQLMYTHQMQNYAATQKYKALIVPFKPDSSFLYEKIVDASLTIGSPMGERMPQRQNPLPQNQIDAIKSWILRGAPND